MDAEEADEIAIRALGSLFKIAEVYLWDDFCTNKVEPSQTKSSHEVSISDICDGEKCSTTTPVDGEYSITEDVELAQAMGALGLPMSFNTNKEKRNPRANGSSKKGKGKIRASKCISNFESETHGISDLFNAVSPQCPPHILKDMPHLEVAFDGNDDGEIQAGVPHESAMDLGGENTKKPLFIENGAEVVADKLNGITVKHEHLDIAELIAQPLCSNAFATHEDSSEDPLRVKCSSFLHDKLVEDDKSENKSCFDSVEDLKSENVCLGVPICCPPNHTEVVERPLAVVNGNETVSSKIHRADELHNWMVIWDTYYETNYYYNIATKESTWYPPPGFEEYQSFTLNNDGKLSDVVRGISIVGTKDDTSKVPDTCTMQVTDSFVTRGKEEYVSNLNSYRIDNLFDGQKETRSVAAHTSECKYFSDRLNTDFDGLNSEENEESEILLKEMTNLEYDEHKCPDFKVSKKKKKAKRIRSRQKILSEEDSVLLETTPAVAKYWCQRYSLFSRFDCGIKMDVEGWYSVTPEKIAEHQASRCGNGIFIDCFTGVGGNAIQFAMMSKHVLAVDIDPRKIDYARHNATVYGVQDRIDFIVGDFFQLMLRGDIVFLSPPWGGPDYGKVQTYDIQTMLQPHNADLLFKTACKISPRVVMFLPRNVNLNQLAELALTRSPPWELEVEKNFLNGKLKAVTAYFRETSGCRSRGQLPCA